MKKKSLLLVLALVLVVSTIVGGTLAWLTDSTTAVTNTFTTPGIDIDLTETWNTDTNSDGTEDAWTAKLIPGYEYTKDPKVTVETTTTEDIWLFVKFEEKNASCLTYTSLLATAVDADGNKEWTQGTGTGEGGNGVPTNVWFRVVKASDTTKEWYLLKDNKVAVNDTLTKEAMSAQGFTAPELVYTAYACQYWKSADANFTAAEAWAKVGS